MQICIKQDLRDTCTRACTVECPPILYNHLNSCTFFFSCQFWFHKLLTHWKGKHGKRIRRREHWKINLNVDIESFFLAEMWTFNHVEGKDEYAGCMTEGKNCPAVSPYTVCLSNPSSLDIYAWLVYCEIENDFENTYKMALNTKKLS